MNGRHFDSNTLAPWLEVRFDRAEGPGGQNVNKVNTRATLLFDFEGCPLLRSHEKALIRARLVRRLARDGRLRIVAQRQRSQSANRAATEKRLCELLAQALHVDEVRRPTRPTAGSRRRRVEAKRQRGQIKRLRKLRDEAE